MRLFGAYSVVIIITVRIIRIIQVIRGVLSYRWLAAHELQLNSWFMSSRMKKVIIKISFQNIINKQADEFKRAQLFTTKN